MPLAKATTKIQYPIVVLLLNVGWVYGGVVYMIEKEPTTWWIVEGVVILFLMIVFLLFRTVKVYEDRLEIKLLYGTKSYKWEELMGYYEQGYIHEGAHERLPVKEFIVQKKEGNPIYLSDQLLNGMAGVRKVLREKLPEVEKAIEM